MNDSAALAFSLQAFLQHLGQYFWLFVRLGAAFSVVPLFNMPALPVRVRLMLALAITAVAAPLLPLPAAYDPFSIEGIWVMAQQAIIGLAMGVILLVVFQAFALGGQFAAMSMGLGFATMVDPTNGVNVPLVGQFFTLLASLLFLALNGHLAVIKVVVDSFHYLPVDLYGLDRESLRRVAMFGGYMFVGGVLMALPVAVSLLMVNLAFGVMSRAAPALNIFAVGFAITLLAGLTMLALSVPLLLEHLKQLLAAAFGEIGRLSAPHG